MQRDGLQKVGYDERSLENWDKKEIGASLFVINPHLISTVTLLLMLILIRCYFTLTYTKVHMFEDIKPTQLWGMHLTLLL